MGGGDAKTGYIPRFKLPEGWGDYSVNSIFSVYQAQTNLNHEVKSWLNTSFSLAYSNEITNNNGQAANSNSVFWFVDNIPSIYPLFLRDVSGNKVADPIFGGYQYDYGSTGRKFGSLTNAIADANYNTLRANRNDLNGSTSITLKFTKNLSLQNRLGVQYYNNGAVSLVNKFYGSAALQLQPDLLVKLKQKLFVNLNLLNMFRYAKILDYII